MVSTAQEIDPRWVRLLEGAAAAGDLGYAEFVTRWPLSYYRERVRRAGMVGFGAVLDVGCGFGQWSAALALENAHVTGVEVHPGRLDEARRLLRSLGLENAEFRNGDAQSLPFPDASFDALFCYSVFMFTDRARTLLEFARVLRPGGRLYVCTNARGWWLKLTLENLRKNRAMARMAWTAFRSGRQRGMPNATDLRDVPTLLPAEKWIAVEAAGEGRLGGPGGPAPVYDARYLGFDCVIEFVATRRGAGAEASLSPRDIADRRVAAITTETLRFTTYAPRNSLLRYPMPRQPADVVNSTNPWAVEHATEMVRHTNRTAVLRRIFGAVTVNANSDAERLRRCITFAQLRFYHHFAGQPMTSQDHVLLDPIASLVFGACRCGNVARFLIDLFEVNCFPARLLGGACHTSAEVLLDGRWALADASLYPPGIVPKNATGSLLGLDEALANPALLDAVPNYVNYERGHIALLRGLYPEAQAAVEGWLREPILPSVAFFGAAFAGGRVPGSVQRWRKTGTPEAWEADADYGWGALDLVETLPGPALPTLQRPQQAAEILRVGETLSWTQDAGIDPGSVEYEVTLATAPRGWSYESIPLGCRFETPGMAIRTRHPWLVIPQELRDKTLYVSIRAFRTGLVDVFCLPSDEIVMPPIDLTLLPGMPPE